ncbi:hypothetical protein DP939_38505 [Spongiactinospora rosea]|uniref:Uncharacterized protein n=1 Tax=Spongiactinospora rosea TaxID=2248750 RepID=A0A366LM13_9ACTN|nr:hypothetical protein [Spongiactinospora rosea]RBQ14857.1 hypothetical protein DP939_38505 [Spongiactinospora rosea]
MRTMLATPSPQAAPALPRNIATAAALWLAAVGAGVLESAITMAALLADGSATLAGLAPQIGLRLLVYGAATFVALRLYRGKPWARVALAVGLGVFGTVSLVIEPIGWLLSGGSVAEAVAGASVLSVVLAAIRFLHLMAVLTALPLMFTPTANAYFRARHG